MKFLKKFNIKAFWAKNFSFSEGVDLNNEVLVLYRRNIVIKNIIFLSNIIYSIFLFVITILSGAKGISFLWTIIPLPLTFVLNQTINKLINSKNKEPRDLLRQQIGMYICAIYMFLSALLVYFKMKTTDSFTNYAEAGYLLFYFSLIVISFYQNTKMLKNIFPWVGAILTVIHFTLTYNFFKVESDGLWDFLTRIIPENIDQTRSNLVDILFRTLVMALFMIAIFVITNVGEKISDERRLELTKRQNIQDDFTDVVSDLYTVILDTRAGYDENLAQIPLLSEMCYKLAILSGLSEERGRQIMEYASYNKNHEMSLNFAANMTSEEKFLKLREEASVAKMVSRRLQLAQKAENIVRAHFEGWATNDFKIKMLNMQNNVDSQIVLLCDMYIILRSAKSYKRPYPHKIVLQYISTEFKVYFKEEILERFIKFNADFENMYNSYGE